MVNARIHIICGNCGASNHSGDITFCRGEIDADCGDLSNLSCKNCATLHSLNELAEKQDTPIHPMSDPKKAMVFADIEGDHEVGVGFKSTEEVLKDFEDILDDNFRFHRHYEYACDNVRNMLSSHLPTEVIEALKMAQETLKFYVDLPKWDYSINGKPDGSLARQTLPHIEKVLKTVEKEKK